METRTKERLTGALIIIALLVVLVPEMLSGPHPTLETGPEQTPQATVMAPVVTYELPVANQPAATGTDQSALMPQTAATDTPALPPPTPVVAVAAPEPVAAVVAETPSQPPVVEKPVSGSRASKPANTKPQAAKTRAWMVQVGSFVKRDNAQHLMQDLKAKGFASQLSEDTKARLFRVKAGPVADRAAAQALQAKLVAAGYRATISAP